MRIAITGGIGSGKSYVCQMLREQGIGVYDCDKEAKRLMRQSPVIREAMCQLIGDGAYKNGEPVKSVISSFLLASENNKQAINRIVHPAVMQDFYDSGMEYMECAILYDAHLEGYVDRVVCVVAPENIRVERIMKRDGITADQARQWIAAQTPQQIIAQKADVVIVNDGVERIELEKITNLK